MPDHTRIDPRYTFYFQNGRTYSREVYWEDLYLFSYGGSRILAASRVVPHSSAQYAFYELLKSDSSGQTLRATLPEWAAPLSASSDEPATALAKTLQHLLPDRTIPLDETLRRTGDRMEEAVSLVLAERGFRGGLDAFGDPQSAQSPAFADPTDPMHALARSDGEDTALIQLSFEVDRAVKDRLREHREASAGTAALAMQADVEFDLLRQLYSNPSYVGFVKRVMDAKGGYISPVVRNFLSFYTRALNHKLAEQARQEGEDPQVLRKRVEGLLGRVKGDSHHFLDYHDLTILGSVEEGEVPADTTDPDATGYSFRVDADPASLLLREIEDPTRRYLIRKFVEHTFNTHHNVKSVRFLDEIPPDEFTAARPRGRVEQFLERIEQRLTDRFVPRDEEERARLINRLLLLAIAGMGAFFVAAAWLVISLLQRLG